MLGIQKTRLTDTPNTARNVLVSSTPSPIQLELPLTGYSPAGYECGCRTCNRVFSSEEAFDLHRVGDYSQGRKCAENPATQGLTLSSRGTWQRDRSVNATGGES